MSLPQRVKIVEVGPRDGLQNEKQPLSTDVKLALIQKLAASGLTTIEATSFVSAKKIPQLADHSELLSQLDTDSGVHYPVLVPNLKGYNNARAAGAKEISFFTAASETFCQKNINCSIQESLARMQEIMGVAKSDGISVRAYISCVLGCPYEGNIPAETVKTIAAELLDMGAYEISLGDTIGVGTPQHCVDVFTQVAQAVPMTQLAAHFHNTYGQALANLYAVLQLGITTIDSSVAGLGGCPYAKGASGNVATEDVVYMLEGCGIECGVDLTKLIAVSHYIAESLGIEPRSSLARVR